jgi:hypothetical protein
MSRNTLILLIYHRHTLLDLTFSLYSSSNVAHNGQVEQPRKRIDMDFACVHYACFVGKHVDSVFILLLLCLVFIDGGMQF